MLTNDASGPPLRRAVKQVAQQGPNKAADKPDAGSDNGRHTPPPRRSAWAEIDYQITTTPVGRRLAS
jgi:hypothetical protein